MTPGWKLACWIVAMVLLVLEALAASPLKAPGVPLRVRVGALGLALFILPFAWDAGSA